jgi:flavorubredoxin
MDFRPVPPTIDLAPELVAPDTWLVHQVQEALGAPLHVYLNSMVFTGREPLILDTGTVANRRQWLEDVFTLVPPEEVRWVFLSHDDADHTGNLAEVMARCPNATLVCSWSILERHTNAFAFPLERCRWVGDGETLDAGDRTFRAVRPPTYDSPTTRGLLDESTGVYWGVDSFACPSPGEPVATVAELDPEFWREGMAMFNHNALSPWLSLVDPERFGALCDRVRALGMTTIATAHSPLIGPGSIDDAFALLRDLPIVDAPPVPDQAALEAMLVAAGAGST